MIDINELRKVACDCYWPTSHVPISKILDRLEAAEKERDALRTRIEQMEKQEPVAKVRVHRTGGNAGIAWSVAPLNDFDSLPLMRDGDRLYALPGAQAQKVPKAVAYLDLGTGGYMDIGTDLTDEELAALPKGRHMLGVIGTYGVDGYVPAQNVPECPYPCGWQNLLKHAIEDGAYLARSINEDEPVTKNVRSVVMLMVMRLRDVLMAIDNAVPEAKHGWLRAIDEALIVAHIGVANESDTYEQAKVKLDNLIGFHVSEATDPAVNGGWQLAPIVPLQEMSEAGVYAGGIYYDVVEAVYEAMLGVAAKIRSEEL